MSEEKILDGQTALVTGAGGGIGRSIVLKLAELGAGIVINYSGNEVGARETEELAKKAGAAKTLVVKADVSKSDPVKEMFEKAMEAFGRIDILVNNSGVTADGLLLRMSKDNGPPEIRKNRKSFEYSGNNRKSRTGKLCGKQGRNNRNDKESCKRAWT